MKIEISRAYDLPELAACWTELETRAAGNFFLSWRWIGTWLRSTGAQPLLVKAMEGDVVLGLGLLTPLRRKRHFLSVNQLCLHETGIPQFDALMIEYNNFLIARSAPADLALEILRALQCAEPGWDEIVLGGVSSELTSTAQAAGLHIETDRLSPHFGVELSAPERWEDTLSANQRAQLRQSRAFAERIGPLKLQPAAGTRQALEFFDKMAAMHTAYWQRRGKAGAFATQFSQRFHHELISYQAGPAQVELLELTAGSQVLGYLYNFQDAGRTYNYQGGFSYIDDNRHRPGLIAHAMAIEQAARRGMLVYDFLAGDAPYKARLGHPMGTMVWCRLQRDRPLLNIERSVRRLYRGLRGLAAAPDRRG
jgi:CelD/BcsL family acetyltransferase involved in cellulose biosynthesis